MATRRGRKVGKTVSPNVFGKTRKTTKPKPKVRFGKPTVRKAKPKRLTSVKKLRGK